MIRSRSIALSTVIWTIAPCGSVAVMAQLRNSATVSGRVVTSGDHIPIPRARVELNTSHGTLASVLTDGSGQFAFSGVPADRYTLAASLPGYLPTDAKNETQIQAGDHQTFDDIAIELVRGAVLAGVISNTAGAPVVNGKVRIQQESSDPKKPGPSVTTQTDDRGAFRMWGMPPGTYFVSSTLDAREMFYAGAVSVKEARGILVNAGEEVTNVAFAIPSAPSKADGNRTQSGIISGIVYEDVGRPAAGARVEAKARNSAGGLKTAATSRANDRGEYRLWGLPPGQYYLSATSMLSTPVDGLGTAALENGGHGRFWYVQTFYPGTESLNRAEPVTVKPAEEITAFNFSLQFMSITPVRGVVLDKSGTPQENAVVTVVEHAYYAGRPVGTFSAETNRSGTFEIADVPPGQYTIEAVVESSQPRYVSVPLAVTGTPMPDLPLVLNKSVAISGGISWQSNAGRRFNPQTITVSVRRISPAQSGRMSNARILADGTFTLAGIWPGKYEIRALNIPEGWFLSSLRMGETEITDGVFDLPSNGQPGDMRLVFCERRP